MVDFSKLKDDFLIKEGKYLNLVSEKEKKEKILKDLEKDKLNKDKVRELYLKAGNAQREKIKNDIEDIVTNALQYIMQEEVYFIINPVSTRGRIEFEFFIRSIRDGKKDTTPVKNSRGDGVTDIVDMALNIAILELSGSEGPLIIDEPTKQVSAGLLPNVGDFLQEISHTLGRQIIFITHHKDT